MGHGEEMRLYSGNIGIVDSHQRQCSLSDVLINHSATVNSHLLWKATFQEFKAII